MTIAFTSSPARHRRSPRAGGHYLTLLVLALVPVVAGRGLAEDPWSSSSLGWSSAPSGAWSSWETTTGGTFGGSSPSPSHHFKHLAPGVSIMPPPAAVHDAAIDPVMIKAANIAEDRALPHGTLKCWRFVKEALVAAGGVSSYPQTAYARDAGRELVEHYGFVRLPVHSAESAPIGSVLVYGGPGAGHVELRSARGFASDFRCSRPASLPFLGAYTRLAARHHANDTAQVVAPVASGS